MSWSLTVTWPRVIFQQVTLSGMHFLITAPLSALQIHCHHQWSLNTPATECWAVSPSDRHMRDRRGVFMVGTLQQYSMRFLDLPNLSLVRRE